MALARALINRPAVLLLDEPLAALDRKLRRDMQIELQNLQRNVGITFLLVTHDQEEALSMSDRVCIMRDGRIVQIGTPRELYDEPVNGYVADFVGKSNFFAGTRRWRAASSGSPTGPRLQDGRRRRHRVPARGTVRGQRAPGTHEPRAHGERLAGRVAVTLEGRDAQPHLPRRAHGISHRARAARRIHGAEPARGGRRRRIRDWR